MGDPFIPEVETGLYLNIPGMNLNGRQFLFMLRRLGLLQLAGNHIEVV